MASLGRDFLSLIERNVRFDYHAGAVTRVGPPFTTGWRVVPSLVVSQIDFALNFEQAEGKPTVVRPGQTVAIAPGVAHRLTVAGRRGGISRWSHIQCEVFQGVSLFHLLEPPLLTGGERSRRIGAINEALAKIAPEASASLEALVRRQALGWELVMTLLEGVTFKTERLDLVRNASRLTPVLAHIEENLARPISHALLARAAGLSPSRFHALFRAALGCAPYEYVRRLRLKKAQQLLIRTDRSIAEIGQDVGHPDPYHFSRTFRRSVGVSPSVYRRQMLRQAL